QARSAAIALAIGLVASAFIMFAREEAQMLKWIPDQWAPTNWRVHDGVLGMSIGLAAMGVGSSYSLLSIGSGMIIGLRINFWMIVGGILGWVVAPLMLLRYGQVGHNATRNE